MFKFIKTFFIKHNTSVNDKVSGLKSYPKSINNVGIFCVPSVLPDANLITKLKTKFGNQTQFYIFVLAENHKDKNLVCLNLQTFDLFGKFKDHSISSNLTRLDMIVDMTQEDSIVKNYAVSMANQSYKIALGHYPDKKYNLSFKLISFDQDSFAEEIIKYHNILNNAKR